MAWRLVIQPNGLFARFSEVVDDFTHYDMDEAEVLRTAFKEWNIGEQAAREKMDRARRECATDVDREGPPDGWIEGPPLARFGECLAIIYKVHGPEAAKNAEAELSAPKGKTDDRR